MKRLVREISHQEDIDPYYVSRTLDVFKEHVKAHLMEGKTIDLGRDFGKLVNIETQPREYRVPKTGEKRVSEAVRKVRFRPSAAELHNMPVIGKTADESD